MPDTRPDVSAGPLTAMLRGAGWTALAPALPVAAAASLASGWAGLRGALAGAALVLAFSGSTLVIMRAARRVDPLMTLAVAMALYTTKASLLFVAAPLLREAALSRPWAAAAAVLVSAAWSAGLVRAFTRLRLPVFDGAAAVPGGAR